MKPSLTPQILAQLPAQARLLPAQVREAADSAQHSARELLDDARNASAPARAQVREAAERARTSAGETREHLSERAHKAGAEASAFGLGVTAAGVMGILKVLSLPIEALEIDALDDLDVEVEETELP